MATLAIPAKGLLLREEPEVKALLASIGIEYERWPLDREGADADADAVLKAYAAEIETMKSKGGYTTADIIDVDQHTPELDVLLDKFKTEHTHDEDEVRFVIAGRGIFHIHPVGSDIVAIEVVAGDMIRVPRGTRHWFNLCSDRKIRAIRWFQNKTGWTPHYTDSGIDSNFEPLCFGPAYSVPRYRLDVDSNSPLLTPKLYLLDVEGTTSPISYVYDVLIPYARDRMSDYVTRHSHEPTLRAELQSLAQERRSDQANPMPATGGLQASIDYLIWLTSQDRKSTALKSVQGRIWAEGYEHGELHGEVFPDVPAALRRWRRTARVAIYSSGSVEAQRSLFNYATCGDLTQFIDAYFDTQTGLKWESASYRKIAAAMSVAASEVLFVSDAVRELDAAREAAMMTLLSLRPGNPPVANDHGHPTVRSLESIE